MMATKKKESREVAKAEETALADFDEASMIAPDDYDEGFSKDDLPPPVLKRYRCPSTSSS